MKRIKTGIIGCGKVGDIHAGSFADLAESEFTAVYSRSYDKTKSFAEKYGMKAACSIEEMADMGVEAVSICSPHPAHAENAVAAFESGMHVLIEKPLAVTLSDCDIIINASKRAGRALGVVYQRRFYPPCVRMKKAISDGKIGKPILGTVVIHGWRDEAYYKSDPWRGSWSGEGGGVLVNQAPHLIDLLLWYMGEVDEVYGVASNFNHPYIEVEDTAVATIKYKSGALGCIIVSNSQNPALYGKVHVFGSNGAGVGVQTDGGAMFIPGMTKIEEPPVNDLWTVEGEEALLEVWKKEDEKSFFSVDSTRFYHDRQIENFLRSITGKEDLLVTGEDGRKTVEIFSAIYRATKEGKPQKLRASIISQQKESLQ